MPFLLRMQYNKLFPDTIWGEFKSICIIERGYRKFNLFIRRGLLALLIGITVLSINKEFS